jgi:Cytochrome c554 and c-prime
MRSPSWSSSRQFAAVLLWLAFIASLNVLAVAQEHPCAKCHAAQVATQPQTPMGRALQLPGANPTLEKLPKLTFSKGGYTYTVETREGKSTYSVTDGARSVSLPLHWGLGTGAQTWILERDGKLYESMVSYYPSISGLGITTGDESLAPHTVEEALGRELGQPEIKSCFGCHSSNTFTNGRLNLQSLQPGVNCEHCHTGATTHLLDAIQGEGFSTLPDLRKLSSEEISTFCGQCHRTWDVVVRSHWRDQANVRFQPYRLANSRCYDGTDPRISCIACHDPHQDVVRSASFYDTKCLACHGPAHETSAPGITAAKDAPRSCPVAKANCTSCHMPKVELPNKLITITDHQIRIVKPGMPYPN